MELPRTFGQYVLLSSLGKGAAGEAFLARPLDPKRGIPTPVVIKVLHQRLAGDDEFVKRFRHEADIAVRVESRHIAPTFDVGAVGDALYLAMEYVAGFTGSRLLARLAKGRAPPPLSVAVAITAQCLRALSDLAEAVDSAGRRLEVVHRDISPKNIMIGDDGVVRLIDLGLGKSKAQDWKTRDGRVMGSPGYMPPEQIRGEAVDHRADLYAIAVVCHELLTLRRYIELSSDPIAMLKAALNTPFSPPSRLRPEVPAALDDVLRKAMAPDQKDRFASAADFSRALTAAIAPASELEMAAFAGDLLGAERDQRRAEIRRLLEESVAPAEEVEKTVILAARTGVQHDATPFLHSASQPSLRKTRRSRAPMLAALVASALLLGWGAGLWMRPKEVEVVVVEPSPEPPPPPLVNAVPVAPAVEPIVEIQPIAPPREVPKPIKAKRTQPPPAVVEAPPKPSFDQRLAALDDRAQRMWKQLAPSDPRREPMAKLIRDLSMTKNALGRIAQPENELRALEQRIDAIEK